MTHDTDVEAALLGAVFLHPGMTLPDLDERVFWDPLHQRVFAAMRSLSDRGEAIELATVAAEVRREIPDVDQARFVTLQAGGGAEGSVPTYCRQLREAHQARELRVLGAELTQDGGDVASILERATDVLARIEAIGGIEEDDSWRPVDLARYLSDDVEPVQPTILARDDGHCLFYAGRTHSLNAESETNKTWVVLHACEQEIRKGHKVWFLDFEDNAEGMTERLVSMGLKPEEILEQFVYFAPCDQLTATNRPAFFARLEADAPSLVALDGVTEVLHLYGLKTNDNDDIAAFYGALVRPIARQGPAVVTIDHIPKDGTSKDGIGGQHKRAGITGAAYSLSVRKIGGRGRTSEVAIEVRKDRQGYVRAYAEEGKRVARFVLVGYDDGAVEATLYAPAPGGAEEFQPTYLMEQISRQLEGLADPVTQTAATKLIKGKGEFKIAAFKALVAAGHLVQEPGSGAPRYRSITPYREEAG